MTFKKRANPAKQADLPDDPEAVANTEVTGEDHVAQVVEEKYTTPTPLVEPLPQVKMGDDIFVFYRSPHVNADWYPAKVVQLFKTSIDAVVFIPYSVPVQYVSGLTEGEAINNYRRK